MSDSAGVDLREATGVQVGSGNTQIIYQYDALTWTDGVLRPPIATISGAVESPYRGLGAYGERDAPYFFGREQITTELLERLGRAVREGQSRVVVSGVSGAGKSSLLRAGLMPRLRGAGLSGIPDAAHWPCLFFTPGADPLGELSLQLAALAGVDAAAVRREAVADARGLTLTIRQATAAHSVSLAEVPRPDSNVQRRMLLVVDQFEQLFARVDPVNRRHFLQALEVATAGHGEPAALLLIGIRADFEARCAELAGFAHAVQDRLLITGMTRRQLRQVVTGPAGKAGVSVEDALVDTLLDEVGTAQADSLTAAGALPLLSHALDQAWRRRNGADLTLADYERTGGIEGAVAASAQHCYERLSRPEQQVAREVFTRLVTVSDDGSDTVRRVSRAEFFDGCSSAQAPMVEHVLDAFAGERLLTLAAGAVELSHEVIVRSWPLLRDEWLAETRALRAVRGRWEAAARLWQERGRESSYLLRGRSLAEARACADDVSGLIQPPNPREAEFLGASISAERKRVLARRSLIAALAVVALALGVLAVVAMRASSSARQERDVAIAGQLVDDSERAQSSDPHAAAVMALAAFRLKPSAETRYAVAAAAAQPSVAALHVSSDTVRAVAVSPDGSLLATDTDPGVTVWDMHDLRQVAHLETRNVSDLAFTPDSKLLAVASFTGVQLADPRTARVERVLQGSSDGVESITFSPDGAELIGWGYESVRAWTVATGKEVGSRAFAATTNYSTVAFSPDAHSFVLAGDPGLLVFSPTARLVRVRIPDIMDVAFSPDGKHLAAVTYEGRLRILDTRTWRVSSRTVGVPEGSLLAVTFADRGRLIAASGSAGIQVWRSQDLVKAAPLLAAGDGPVDALAASPDGRMLVAGTTLGVVHLWNLSIAAPETGGVASALPETNSVAIAPDGSMLAIGHRGGSVDIVATRTGRRIQLLHTGMQDVTAVDFSPTGHSLTVAGGNVSLIGHQGATVAQWSYQGSWQQVRRVGAPGPRIASMDVSPTGEYIAAAGYDGSVEEWDGSLAKSLWVHRSQSDAAVQPGRVGFSADGRTLAVGDWQGKLQLLDPATGHARGSFTQPDGFVDSLSYTSNDRMLAVGSSDGRILIWDTRSRHVIGRPIDSGGIATFAPNDREIFTADASGIHVWDAATRQQLGSPLTGNTGPVTAIALTADGNTLVTGYADGNVSKWDVSYLKNPIRNLCTRPGATYTNADWRTNVPAGPSPRQLCP